MESWCFPPAVGPDHENVSSSVRKWASKKQTLASIAAFTPFLTGMASTLVINSTYSIGIRLLFATMIANFAVVLVGPLHRLFTHGPTLEVDERGFTGATGRLSRFRGMQSNAGSRSHTWEPDTSPSGCRIRIAILHQPRRDGRCGRMAGSARATFPSPPEH